MLQVAKLALLLVLAQGASMDSSAQQHVQVAPHPFLDAKPALLLQPAQAALMATTEPHLASLVVREEKPAPLVPSLSASTDTSLYLDLLHAHPAPLLFRTARLVLLLRPVEPALMAIFF